MSEYKPLPKPTSPLDATSRRLNEDFSKIFCPSPTPPTNPATLIALGKLEKEA